MRLENLWSTSRVLSLATERRGGRTLWVLTMAVLLEVVSQVAFYVVGLAPGAMDAALIAGDAAGFVWRRGGGG